MTDAALVAGEPASSKKRKLLPIAAALLLAGGGFASTYLGLWSPAQVIRMQADRQSNAPDIPVVFVNVPAIELSMPGGHGRVLTLWNDAMRFRGGDEVRWGPELTGELVQRDGSQILVRSSTGFESTGTQGPLLPAPPVSREHLRALLTSPEVLPKTP